LKSNAILSSEEHNAMSWSLEVFSPHENQATIAELSAKLSHDMPRVAVYDDSETEPVNGDDTAASVSLPGAKSSGWSSLALAEVRDRALVLAHVQASAFPTECNDDPQVLSNLASEIALSDAEDGTLDEQYTSQLSQLLRDAQWHYIVSVEHNDNVEQEYVVVQVAYALSQLAGGIVHDLQSGAWMDADLFENLLDAYDTTDT
jgi:hypothetical protein